MNEYSTTYGARLREERKRLGMSQDELAEQLLMSRSSVAFYESDRTVPDVTCMVRAAKVGVDAGYVMFGQRGAEQAERTLDWDLLAAILRGIHDWAEEYGLDIAAEKQVAIARVLYRQFARSREIDAGMMKEMLKLAA